jgi:hypothetical protein
MLPTTVSQSGLASDKVRLDSENRVCCPLERFGREKPQCNFAVIDDLRLQFHESQADLLAYWMNGALSGQSELNLSQNPQGVFWIFQK